MKKTVIALILTLLVTGAAYADGDHDVDRHDDRDEHHAEHFEFKKDSLVVSRECTAGLTTTVNVGDVLAARLRGWHRACNVLPAFQAGDQHKR